MRIIAVKTLKDFWEKYPEAKAGLKEWYKKMKKGEYQTPNEVTGDFKGADYIGNTRIIFNIAKNKYRLIVAFRYDKQICWVKFVGTHSEYDSIDPKNVEF